MCAFFQRVVSISLIYCIGSTKTLLLGILFAYQYGVCFTAALTFARAPYHFNSIQVGLVLLSFGLGNLAGSILGGRWSDYVLAKLKEQNEGVSVPEVSCWLVCVDSLLINSL
jgi:MFS family permease